MRFGKKRPQTASLSAAYDAYGNTEQSNLLTVNPFGYCGEYFDSETGFLYLRARYYDPTTGRFTSEDTHWNTGNMIYGDEPMNYGEVNRVFKELMGQLLSNPNYNDLIPDLNSILQSGNLYAYCMNNPVMYTDPSGGIAITTCIIIGGIVGAVVGGFAGAYVSKKTTGTVSGTSVVIGVIGGATVGSLFGWGLYAFGASVSASGIVTATPNLYRSINQGVNFSKSALQHMGEAGRAVPVQILIEAIKNGTAVVDPQGSRAMMYYIEVYTKGKSYILEVLYDVATNTIWHFMYK